jgi:hypothetical protein
VDAMPPCEKGGGVRFAEHLGRPHTSHTTLNSQSPWVTYHSARGTSPAHSICQRHA